MGANQSTERGKQQQQTKKTKDQNSNHPIREEENSNKPITKEKQASKDGKRSSLRRPKDKKEKAAVDKGKSKNDKPGNKLDTKPGEVSVNGDVKPKEAKENPKPKQAKENPKPNSKKTEKSERTSQERENHRKEKEHIEREKKMPKVTKDQLLRLSSSLQRTSWYLGRRLGMDNSQATRYQSGFATEQERKYQMLLWWRRVHGLKATPHRLITLLELGNYTEEEYESILAPTNDNEITKHERPPESNKEKRKHNDKKEHDHSDATDKPGSSYENASYDSTVEAQTYAKKPQKSGPHKSHRKKNDQEKLKSRSHSRENLNSTLPPWWDKSAENIHKRLKARSTEALNQIYQSKESKRQSRQKKSISMHEESPVTPDGTTDTHTDDSGIVASPPMSPKPINQTDLPYERIERINEQLEDSTYQNEPDIQIDQSDSRYFGTQSLKQQPECPVNNNLVVRRCSDSNPTLNYASLPNRRYHRSQLKVPTINEQVEDIQFSKSSDDVTFYEIAKRPSHQSLSATNNHSEPKKSSKKHSKKSKSTSHDDITRLRNDVTNSNTTVKFRNKDTSVKLRSEKSRSAIDIRKGGENTPRKRKDIKSMIDKYEMLTKVNEMKKRESMAESMARYYEWSSTSKNDEQNQQMTSQYASRTSLNSAGSRLSTPGSILSNPRHSKSKFSPYLQRYHYFTFGGKGTFPSRFQGLISGIAILGSGDIVASDGDNKRIQIFDRRGRFLTTFETNTKLKPKGLCVTPDENIAVCCGDAVNVYDREGNVHLSFGQGVFQNNCYCVCCDKDCNFYVTDIVSHTISIHNSRGRIRKRFGFEGTSMIHFNQPVALAINRKNNLFITDSQNHCIKVFTLSGRPLYRIGAQGSADGLFWNPLGICTDWEDNLVVADCGNNRISQFNSEGKFMRHLLTEEDGIRMPSLVQMNKHGQLIVCEWEKQLVKVFTIETSI